METFSFFFFFLFNLSPIQYMLFEAKGPQMHSVKSDFSVYVTEEKVALVEPLWFSFRFNVTKEKFKLSPMCFSLESKSQKKIFN